MNNSRLTQLGSFLWKNSTAIILLLVLIWIVGYFTLYRVKLQVNIGPGWDTYAFMANALYFAGQGIGYVELNRPPFLSAVTAVFYKLGYVYDWTIFFVDGGILVFGAVGLYLFLKLRFNSILSFLGALLFVTFPTIINWVGVGYSDVASVSFSIWTLYFTVLAVKKNSKFYYLAIPFLIMTFLTRFPAVFIVFPMMFYIFAEEKNFLKNFKDMVIGFIGSVLVFIPFLAVNFWKYGDPFAPYTSTFSVSGGSTASESIAYVPSPYYYIEHMGSYVSSKSAVFGTWIYHLIIIIIVTGFLIYVYDAIKTKRLKNKLKAKTKFLRFGNVNLWLTILFTLSLVGFIFTFNKVNYMVSEVIFFSLTIVTYYLLKDVKDIDIDLLFLVWFMVFFIFHSVYAVKVDRYFITMAPAVAYFIVLGLSKITGKLSFKIKKINLTSWILSVILIFMVISSTNGYMHTMYQEPDYIVTNATSASNWFKTYDPNYKDKTIYSDIWPTMSWELSTNVQPMPTFNNSSAFEHQLEKYGIDYYFAVHKMNMKAYDVVGREGTVAIYQKNPSKFEEKPRMLYIGKNWQHYIEDVLEFKAYVYDQNPNGNGSANSIFIDDYTPEELNSYPYVLLYNFGWHDKKKAQDLLLNYASEGGTVVIDGSNNLDGIYYNLNSTVFLDMIITRQSLPPHPDIWIDPKLNQTTEFAPFFSDGQTWYGANYKPLNNNTTLENLVTVNGNTLIGVQKIGKGKIIWMGYNFVWHAFHLESKDEGRLIQEVLGV